MSYKVTETDVAYMHGCATKLRNKGDRESANNLDGIADRVRDMLSMAASHR